MPTKKIYINTLAQITGKIITALISILMIKVLTGYLDIAGYGLYSKLYNYISIFAVIADLGLYTITVREISKHQHDPKRVEHISGNILSLRTISGLIIIVLSLAIAPFLSGYESHGALIGILIVAIFTLFGLINSSIMSYLQAVLHTEFSLIANTSGKLLTFFMILGSAYFVFTKTDTDADTRLYLVLLSGLAGNILMTAMTWWYASRYQKIRFYWDTKYIIFILRTSLPYGIALFLGVIFFKIDVILLSVMEDAARADTVIALYSLPMKIVEVGMMYSTIFLNSLLPVLTLAIEENRVQDTKKLTKKGFELLFGFGAGISIFLAFFARDVIRVISTEAFIHTTIMGATAVDAMRIVAWIFLFYFVSSLSNYTLIAKGDQQKIMYVNAGIALINIVGNIIVIPHYSFIGSAWVTLLTQGVLVAVTWYLVRSSYENRAKLLQSLSLLVIALMSGFIALGGADLFDRTSYSSAISAAIHGAIGGIIFGICYLGGWFAVRVLLWKKVKL